MQRRIDVVGRQFGKLTAIKCTGGLRGNTGISVYLWRCDCGNEFERPHHSVQNSINLGFIPVCDGCRFLSTTKNPGESMRNSARSGYKYAAKQKGLEWRLTDEHLDRLFASNCHYCGTPPNNVSHQEGSNGEFIYQGIDRIDSELDYVPFNVVPCCKSCNYAKLDRPYLEFVSWIKRASEHLSA